MRRILEGEWPPRRSDSPNRLSEAATLTRSCALLRRENRASGADARQPPGFAENDLQPGLSLKSPPVGW